MAAPRRLNGKVALLTGAASGIGEETARLFAANGAFFVIAGIDDELGQQVATSIGGEKATPSRNAAVVGSMAPTPALDMADFDNVMATNVRGVVATIKHAGRAMVAGKIRGSSICTGSVAATISGIGPLAYTISKHAVVGAVNWSCGELGAHGIRVNYVSPYPVR